MTTKTQRAGSTKGERSSKHSKKSANSKSNFPPKPKSYNYSSTKRQTISEAQHTEKGGETDANQTEMMTHEVSNFDNDFSTSRHLLQINRHLKNCEAVAHR